MQCKCAVLCSYKPSSRSIRGNICSDIQGAWTARSEWLSTNQIARKPVWPSYNRTPSNNACYRMFKIYCHLNQCSASVQYYALINRARGPYEEIFVLTFKAYGPHAVSGSRPIKLQESRSGPHTNRTPYNNACYRMFKIYCHVNQCSASVQYYALINRARGPYEEIFVLTFKAYGPNAVRSMHLKCQNKYFPYGPKSRLIRALLYTYPNKTV